MYHKLNRTDDFNLLFSSRHIKPSSIQNLQKYPREQQTLNWSQPKCFHIFEVEKLRALKLSLYQNWNHMFCHGQNLVIVHPWKEFKPRKASFRKSVPTSRKSSKGECFSWKFLALITLQPRNAWKNARSAFFRSFQLLLQTTGMHSGLAFMSQIGTYPYIKVIVRSWKLADPKRCL